MVVMSLLLPLLGAFSTYELAKLFEGKLVRVASATTLIFYGVWSLFVEQDSLSFELALSLFYSGVFIGMSSESRLSRIDVFIASIILSFVHMFISPWM